MKQNFLRSSPERAYPNFRSEDILESIGANPARVNRPLPPVMDMAELTNGELGRTPLRRARPLTRIQEVLVVSAAFVFGVVLQMLVILYISGILE